MIRTLSITAALALFVRSAFAGIVVTGVGLTLEEEGGTFAINNLAASGTAFAKDLLEGYPSHTIPHLNDSTYGNSNSWIAGSANSFAGINLGATPVRVNRVAFGRDNLGVQTGDRVIDTYTLQYTTVANPDASTPDANWTTIGTLTYTEGGPIALRHLYSFTPVMATGLRLKTVADGTCIDEIEIYNVSGPGISVQLPAGTDIDEGRSVDIGSVTIGSTSALKTFTIVNTGTQNLTGLAITKHGTNASEFTVSALSSAALAPAAARTFTVSFKPTKSGTRTAALRIASNVTGTKNPFDIQLTGTPVCPTITVNKPATTSGMTSAAFSQSFTQTGGVAPIVYSTTDDLPSGITLSAAGRLSGTTTDVGVFNITVAALDSRGCTGTSSVYSLTINRGPGPQLVVEQPVSNVVPSAGTVAFGNQLYGTSTTKTFTIRNTGTSVLNLGSMSMKGLHVDRFTVGALSGTSSIAAGDSRTFSVTYQPTAFGSNITALNIPSNDLVTPITSIRLTGTSVCPTITVTNPTVTNANTVEPFSQAFTQTGSIGTTSFTTTSTLPAGLTLSSTGELSGTPTEEGTFAITVTATGDLGCSGTSEVYTLTVVRPPLLTITVEETVGVPLPDDSADQGSILTGETTSAKTYTITNTGSESITLNAFAKSGTNPGDFTVSAASSSTISAGGTATFTITFTPTRGGPRSAVLHVNGSDGTLSSPVDVFLSGTGLVPTITITHPTVTTATTGVAFSQVFTQVGGLGTTTFSIASGTPPAGVFLAEDGTFAGTPTRTGRFPITVRATDAFQTSATSAFYTLVVAHGTGPQLVVEQPTGLAVDDHPKVLFGSIYDENESTRDVLPSGLDGVTALALGGGHALARKSNGTVVAWGNNDYGQTEMPSGLTGVQAIAAGATYSLALKSDGDLIGWGNIEEEVAIEVPVAAATNVVAIGAGFYHVLVVKTDGTVLAFGNNDQGQCNVPSGLTDVVAVAAGERHSVALKGDGTVVAWGSSGGRLLDVPQGLTQVVAVACGDAHTLALKADGTVVSWGFNKDGELDPPPGLIGVKSISVSNSNSFALKRDGNVVRWGDYEPQNQSIPNVQVLTAGYGAYLLLAPAVNFGQAKLGEPNAPVTLTLRNAGTAPLTLGAITVDSEAVGAEYLVSAPSSSTISPGDSATLDVTFLPLKNGARYATLQIASNDTAATPTSVLLAGTSVSAVVTIYNPVVATGTVGQIFSQQFTQTGLVGEVSWGIGWSTGYPTGLELSRDGRLSGVPRLAGTFPLFPGVSDPKRNTVDGPIYWLTINEAPAARFAVTAPNGDGLQSGDVVDLQASQIGVATAPRVFTVSNVGQLSAPVGLIRITGADFTLHTLPSTAPLAPGASATFSIVFKPSALGARTASLELPGSALAFPLTGTGSSTPVVDPVVSLAPQDIAVEQPLGFVHTHSSTQALGNLALNQPQLLTYTLRNAGDQPLTGLNASLSGPDAAQFKLVSQPPSSLPGGQSGTFVLETKIASLGPKLVQLRIISNDPNESPFLLNLTATGAAAVVPTVTTLPAGSVISDLYSTRVELHGKVNTQGSLSHVAFDYGPTKAYGFSTLPEAITNNSEQNFSAEAYSLVPHKTYHYRIRAIGGQGSAFGRNMTFTVPNQTPDAQVDELYAAPNDPLTIDVLRNDRDPDGDKLTITSKTAVNPSTAGTVAIVKNKLVFTPSSTFSTGTITFDYSIKDGFGGTDTATVRLTPLPITITPANITRPAAGGSYDIEVTAFRSRVTENLPWLSAVRSTSGVHTSTIQITLAPNTSAQPRRGRIIIDGQTHDVEQLGVTKPSITPMSSTPHEAIVSGFFSLAIPLVDGPATFTATHLPPGLRINNVTNLISGIPTTPGTFNVVIRARNAAGPLATDTAGAAAATAAITINVSPLDPNFIGTYHGLISPSQVAYLTPNVNVGARLALTTTARGGITGQILEGRTRVSLRGQLQASVADPDHPVAILNLIGPKTKRQVTLNVTLDKTRNTLAGALYLTASPAASTPVEGWRNPWNTDLPASDYNALHTFAIENVSTVSPSPDGFGFGNFTPVANTGLIMIKGNLADGSPIVCSTFVGPTGQVLFYQPLYANTGSCVGKLDITRGPAPPQNNSILGQLTWFKPAALPKAKDLIYRAGFGPIALDAAGSSYPAPAPNQRVMSLPTSAAKLAFTLGGLNDLEFEQLIAISESHIVTIDTPINSTSISILNAATGLFSGSFSLSDTPARKAHFNGQIVRIIGNPTTTTRGYGYFLLPQPTAIPAQQSGGVILSSP